ncbi:MAG: NADH:ubiquinone reductase (Na(+)-transporting) subunit C [Paludibacteraceae bacterium]|nr:NADH:ubiquinone reductase (Na(+)-transporting) subunit C [Paludibacteraceae bacterium]MBP5482419.1 NADH:ubiquinone reductase (Na(+)-transporting) subunit C [Paludibacteraceae bacterium]
MNTNSNSYTIIYASVMVIIVAFLLAFVSSSLKERQDTNVKLDKMKQILSSLNISEDELKQDAEAAYNKYVVADQIIDINGNVVAENGGFEVPSKSLKDADLEQVPLYVCKVNGETKYVAPLYGAGLWGPIWGYISFNSDKKTVYGTYFSHEGETPGLGAEITTEAFQSSFEGKQLQEGGDVKISVVKNGKVTNSSCEVDGISGGTITSKGVDAMLHDCLKRYANFFNK